jgi:hypothetical protein
MTLSGRWMPALALSLFTLVSGCSLLAPKPQVLYHRPDIRNRAKVVVMPVTDFNGNRSEGAKGVEAVALKNWMGMYGRKNVIPGGPAIDKLNQASGGKYIEFLKTLDEVSMAEQKGEAPVTREYIKAVTDKVGNYNLAFTIVEGGPDQYKSGEVVRIHLGLFDTKALTWKWITKLEDKKGLFGDWRAASLAMVSNSFDTAKQVDRSKVNMAPERAPASEE